MGRRAVMVVTLTPHNGGPTKSLATLLPRLREQVDVILVAPTGGNFTSMALAESWAAVHVTIPRPRRLRQLGRVAAALQILVAAARHRRGLAAIHANGTAELNVAAPAALLLNIPLVVWAHGWELDPWTIRLLPFWHKVLRRVTWVAVSPVARTVMAGGGVPEEETVIVPNPIDRRDIAVEEWTPEPVTAVGFLGYPVEYKGLQLVPDIVRSLDGSPVRVLVFTDRRPDNALSDKAFDALEPMEAGDAGPGAGMVSIVGHLADVRRAYARCDIVLIPSLDESFCRVAAEAMMNALPVVGSDIPALRNLLGRDEAGLLFPVGDTAAAATAIRRLVDDPELRRRLGEEGRRRAQAFEPPTIIGRFLELYGVTDAAPSD